MHRQNTTLHTFWMYLLLLYPVASMFGAMEQQMTYAQTLKKLESLNEEHLLAAWPDLDALQRQRLAEDIDALQPDDLYLQQERLKSFQAVMKCPPQAEENFPSLDAFEDYTSKGSLSHRLLGEQLLAQGKVGVLLVAGGQGTRLSFDGPKGTFPISLIKQKSLFQLFAEKVVAASKCFRSTLPIAIMTSTKNHDATTAFFRSHGNFGLEAGQLVFFMQPELPFLDDQGHLMLVDGQLAKGPDGNGSALKAFVQSGIWQAWKERGVEFLNFILVDNPLADPFDAELIGFTAAEQVDMTLKCVTKRLPEERVGVVVQTEHGPRIIEYSEMDENETKALADDGLLKHRCANISLFCFGMDFIKHSAQYTLPWHLAYKPCAIAKAMGWKFETFIFDCMAHTDKIKVLLYPRAECFAPLKNEKGDGSIETVQKALLKRDMAVLEQISGEPIGSLELELDQEFYYPSKALLERWKGHQGPLEGYITP